LHKDSKTISSIKPQHIKSIVKDEKLVVGKKTIDWKTTLEMGQQEPKELKGKDTEEKDEQVGSKFQISYT